VATLIGTLNEGPLHVSLKQLYARAGDRLEVPLDGYLIDILRGDLIIEVQTSNFASIARKMRDLASRHRVRLVYPVPQERWIVKLPAAGNGQPVRRRSPKRAGIEDVFEELVSFPELIENENFELEVILTREEQVRRFDGQRGRRRHGWVVIERRLLDTSDRLLIRSPADLVNLLPPNLPEPFQTLDLAESFGRSRAFAQKVAYCLRKCRLITQVGKDANAILYTRASSMGCRESA
jgi:hypothetical protein